MKATMLALALTAAALTLGGCATTAPDAVAARTTSHECKIVAVHSGIEAIRNDVRGAPETSALDRAEARADFGQVRLHEPPALRTAHKPDRFDQLYRDC